MSQERERMGADLPNRGQSHNTGFGATKADLKRGYIETAQPPVYDDPHPQRRPPADTDKEPFREPGGFVSRTGFSTERN
jgi:hypothetical protein